MNQRLQEKILPPPHVPSHLVVDFDVYNPPGGSRDLHAAWRRLHAGPDIVWAPYHGGYWILTRAADIDFVQRTHDPFSMKDVTMPAGTRPTRLLPLEADPPEHGPFRSIINPWFTPRRVATLENDVQQLAGHLIDGFKPRGSCEFMGEFALHLPIAIFMRLTNLPMEDREKLLAYTQMTTRGTAAERGEAHRLMMEYLGPVIATRRAAPGDDLLSAVIHAKVGGTPINDTDMMSVLLVILFGGLDTVASTLGFIAHFLAGSRRHREELVADRTLVRRAVDEFMRRFSPSNTARTLSRDFDYKGIHFKKDEKIYVPPLLAGMDDRRYPDAFAIDFHRTDMVHSSFGAGPHRCPGALLAQLEIKLFLQEWLGRVPDFQIQPGETPVFGTGQVNCVERLVLTWPA